MRKGLAERKNKFLLFGSAVAAAWVYLRWARPRQLRWGATAAEVNRPMPGDELVERPSFNATRAVTVFASPEQVWPWIVQMGFGRAGWYSYDLLDNLGRPSADTILPELQNVKPGDLVPLGPSAAGLYVREFETNRWMVWDDQGKGKTSWVWGLYPQEDGSTRLITRVRIRYNWFSPMIVFDLLIEFTDIIMMRKSMLGIKERAEALADTK